MPTAYELERAANIARNKALLEELELKDAVASISAPVKTPKPKARAKPIQPRKSAVKAEADDNEPRRQSARLRRTVEDTTLTPAQKRKREKELAERDAMEAEERLQAEEAARMAKRPRHQDLDWQTLANGVTEETEIPSLRNSLMGFVNNPYPREIGDRDQYVFDDEDKENSEVAELRQRLESLKVVSRAKVTKDRIYSAAYHPEPTKDLIFFGDKHGQLGIWDAQAEPEEDGEDERPAEEREGGRYWKLQTHWPATSKSSISAMKFDPVDAHSLYTCSYDGTVRHLSFVSGISREIYFSDGDLPTCIDLTPDGDEMWITDGNGWLTHLDLRQDRSHARSYQLANNKVGCVSINPVDPHLILTAFNDQIIKIWDARKLQVIGDAGDKPTSSRQKKLDREPTTYDTDEINQFLSTPKGKNALRGEWRHDRAVGAAYWDPHGKRIVSTSYDNNLRLWDFSLKALKGTGPFPTMRPLSLVKHDCQTGRWVTPFKAQWSPNPNVLPHFTIGNMQHSLDIYSCTGEVLARLKDPKRITAVQAVTASHPSIVERVASGNGSGRCVLWAPGAESDDEDES